MMLLAQRTLAGLRRRRGGLMGFRATRCSTSRWRCSRSGGATGEHREALERWKARRASTGADAVGRAVAVAAVAAASARRAGER